MNQTNVLLKSNFIAKKSQNPTKSRIINSILEKPKVHQLPYKAPYVID